MRCAPALVISRADPGCVADAGGAAVIVLALVRRPGVELGGMVLVLMTRLHLDLALLWHQGDLPPVLREPWASATEEELADL